MERWIAGWCAATADPIPMLMLEDMDIPIEAVISADGITPPAGVAAAGGITPLAAADLVGVSAAGLEGVKVGTEDCAAVGMCL